MPRFNPGDTVNVSHRPSPDIGWIVGYNESRNTWLVRFTEDVSEVIGLITVDDNFTGSYSASWLSLAAVQQPMTPITTIPFEGL